MKIVIELEVGYNEKPIELVTSALDAVSKRMGDKPVFDRIEKITRHEERKIELVAFEK